VTTRVRNVNADMSYFEAELAGRGDTYVDLLKKHPVTFISLARQVQAELVARAFADANAGELDVVHIYTNEEDIALPFVQFCQRPVVLTHHDPFTFLVKYKNVFPKYKHLNWLSISLAQRADMPADTNWVGNIYHGLPENQFQPNYSPKGDYVAYLGRIIQPKGVHLAIAAAKKAGLKLKIAGKHYSGEKDKYWQEIQPLIDGKNVEYVGYISTTAEKQEFLGNAWATIMPSLFSEPFGMVAIESLACATPVIALNSGALPEIITNGQTGYIVQKHFKTENDQRILDDEKTARALAKQFSEITKPGRKTCRQAFEERFTLSRMSVDHLSVYGKLK
jgi:glycosyltransferase involved in cell wall biosynthesis